MPSPGVAEGFDLLRLAGDVVGVAVLHVAAGGGPLEVAVELDAVRRVDVDALHLAAQSFALGQASHDLEGVAEDHAIRPVLVVLVELGAPRASFFTWLNADRRLEMLPGTSRRATVMWRTMVGHAHER